MIRRRWNKNGFTLAEMMMAVAIIIILCGVVFIGVTRYLRSMALLERDGIAKEIFIAAQNHLTAAKGQDYLGILETAYGESEDATPKDDSVYDITGTSGMMEVMLPPGSIDETIRGKGNFIIRYQPSSAKVLDVFYCSLGDRFEYSLSSDDFSRINSWNYKSDPFRKGEGTDSFNGGKSVLGWFGDEKEETLTKSPLSGPTMHLENKDVLFAEVNCGSGGDGVVLQIFIEGVTSGVYGYFEYPTISADSTTKLVLDDVTSDANMFCNLKTRLGEHFYTTELNTDFIPGEDIRVYAKLMNTKALAPVKKTAVQTTNSLFAAIVAETRIEDSKVIESYSTAHIENFRHLENLYDDNSMMPHDLHVMNSLGSMTYETILDIKKAVQTKDLIWDAEDTGGGAANGFLNNIVQLGLSGFSPGGTKASVYDREKGKNTEAGCYLPLKPDYELEYDGAGHSITWLRVEYEGDAGLIGRMAGGKISNLELQNFSVESKGYNAGALAGSLISTEATSWHTTDVTNVIARNTDAYTLASNIISSKNGEKSGAAGGLIGHLKGNSAEPEFGDVEACAASLYVKSDRNAGGLIGTIEGTTVVKSSYSGGHTLDAGYSDNTVKDDAATKGLVNVIGGSGASAGGLVGECGTAKIQNSYSTCSVSGGTVGGLIGTSTGGSVTNCYATGLVKGSTKEGAFAGSLGGDVSGCNYYEIINEREITGATEADVIGYEYLKAVGGASGSEDKAGITAFDADTVDASGKVTESAVKKYNDFTMQDGKTGSAKTNADAVPYDSVLGSYYQNKYHLRTVAQMPGSAVAAGSYVEKHYGDWPAPEIFVINVK